MKQESSSFVSWWKEVYRGVRTSATGLRLTWQHAWNARRQNLPINVTDERYFAQEPGIVTLPYPQAEIPVPDNGRYQLHNEIEDCIVCDKCAKICPVNCIEIEAVKAPEEYGQTSDGSGKRLYAARFDIDMAKCCFCGLCTTVCPTECLTMSSEYDYSVFDTRELNFRFSDLTPQEADEKRTMAALAAEAKKAAKAPTAPVEPSAAADKPAAPKPAFKPFKSKPAEASVSESTAAPEPPAESAPQPEEAPVKKPFKPFAKKVDTVAAPPVSEPPATPEPPAESAPQSEEAPVKKPFKPFLKKGGAGTPATPDSTPTE